MLAKGLVERMRLILLILLPDDIPGMPEQTNIRRYLFYVIQFVLHSITTLKRMIVLPMVRFLFTRIGRELSKRCQTFSP